MIATLDPLALVLIREAQQVRATGLGSVGVYLCECGTFCGVAVARKADGSGRAAISCSECGRERFVVADPLPDAT